MDIVDWVKKQTGKIADNVKDYKFYVKHTPDFIDSSTTITVTTFNNRDETSTVPCIYKWSRIKNGLTSEVPEFKGNCFICEPSDVGGIIQAEITSTDPAHPGTAILKYGPVKFDIKIKREIQHSLSSGGSVFNVNIVQAAEEKECQIKINQDNIKINHCNSTAHYIFEYNLSEPRIEASLRAPNKAFIYFTERHQTEIKNFLQTLFGEVNLSNSTRISNQQKLQLKFEDRVMRDNFLFILKSFNTKKALRNSAIVKKIENIDLNKNENINYVLEIDSLRQDLFKLGRINDKYLRDKKMYFEEARRYEKEIEEIIHTYTKIAENKYRDNTDLDQSVLELREKKDQAMERKVHGLIRQNTILKERLESMNHELTSRGLSQLAESSIGGMMREDQRMPSRSGFGKKGRYEEVSATGNQFNTILEKLNESDVRESPSETDQVKKLNQEKYLLAKKLNESVMKVSKLEDKVKKLKLNNSAIQINPHNTSSMSIQDQRGNVTQYQIGQMKDSRISNVASQKGSKSNIPYIGSEVAERSALDTEKFDRTIKSKQTLNPEESHTLNQKIAQLQKKNDVLVAQNEKLKDDLDMKIVEIEMIGKEKSAMEAKYKKRLHELLNDNSMYRKNQDALNRSQNLSMEMDTLNGEEIQFLKQQNQFLANENERLEKSLKKCMVELKEIPKLREEILDLKTKLAVFENRKNHDISLSKGEDSMLSNPV